MQVVFGVKQKRRKTLDEAVSATLELESYLHKPRSANCNLESLQAQVVAGVKKSEDTMMQMLTDMLERLTKLESSRATPPYRRPTGRYLKAR